MNTLRECGAVLLFLAALASVVHGLSSGPWWPCLGLAALGFALAYWLWPSRRRGQRQDEHYWLDLLEILVELPVNLLLWLLRLLARPFRDGIDLDL